MNFQQLRTIHETVIHHCDLAAVGRVMDTSATAVGRQIRELEHELGITIFVRTGKRFGGLTEAGKHVLPIVVRLLEQGRTVKVATQDFLAQRRGKLTVAATHSQARYVIPSVVKGFREAFPDVRLHLQQGSAQQVLDLVLSGEADIAIASDALEHQPDLLSLRCGEWSHCALVPAGHALSSSSLTLARLAEFPLITYEAGVSSRASIDRAFAAASITPDVALEVMDADVIKSCVALGMGVGLVASMAIGAARDTGLVAIDARHLFGRQTTRLAIRRSNVLRAYGYAFITSFSPALTREVVLRAQQNSGVGN